ncbi:MAG TPA: hypothetical protein VNV42_10745 [Solirubrobacteraceae bacterium]|nr:hypothetical protein [Solirubrobacteraceae bacterium]
MTPSPGWTLDSFAAATNFSEGQNSGCLEFLGRTTYPNCDAYIVTATNVGGAPTDGGGITLTDTLPKGLTVQQVSLFITSSHNELREFDLESLCSTATNHVKCEYPGALAAFLPSVEPGGTLKMFIYVTVEPGASEALVNRATVSGGGAPEVSVERQNAVSSSLAPFGPSQFSFYVAGLDGKPDTQAGDHPNELVTTIGLDNSFRENQNGSTSVNAVKDIVADLPLGFVGSTLAAPECPLAQLSGVGCPANTIIGHIVTEPLGRIDSIDSPIYNVVPERGVPAEFGYFDALRGAHIFYVHVVPTPAGYVLQTINADIPTIAMTHIRVAFYGDPALRDGTNDTQVPYFTMPTDCSGEEPTATLYMDSWQHPARLDPDNSPVNLEEPEWVKTQSKLPPVLGCNALQFPAEVKAQTTTHESDKPSGLNFEIKLSQSEQFGALGTPTLKKVRVTLPEGFTIDPSAGDGLEACSEAQVGWLGGTHLNFSPATPECPEASKIGSLELETPLIPRTLEGEMFLARQNENPFGSTLAAYVVVHDPITGVLIKIAGEFLPDPHTGQLTAVFDENPNLPFSDLQLHFFGGPRAELATPESCGTFTTDTELTPYSAPDSGPPATPFDDFLIDEACPGGFDPSFTAGSLNLQAGAYTPFVASFERSDADQELAGLSVALPPGLLAKVAGVPECTEGQIREAQDGTGGCPEDTRVGTVKTGVGPGPDPLFVSGKAYWTGPYKGGPFGIAVVVPAVAGPYDFGTVVVRQSVRINPTTAQVTDVSDPFPTILDGIPLRLRRVDLTFDRPEFTFNPTDCEKLGFAGSITGTPLGAPTTLNGTVGYASEPGATSSFATPFQVTNCASLDFAPKFQVSTSGRTSRTGGASLTAKLTEPGLPLGSEANIARVKVELPKQLPSRLTTLQKACTSGQFEADPAGCPAASKIGYAVVRTPIVSSPLEGPAIFVSHGGEAWPSLTVVLQGDGVTIDLVGTTLISKAGVTSTTFKTVPDTPFSSFQLTLPEGPYSALTALGNLCQAKSLVMPTEFSGQNGAEISDKTKIAVAGCAKAKKAKHRKRKARGGKVARARRGGSRRDR